MIVQTKIQNIAKKLTLFCFILFLLFSLKPLYSYAAEDTTVGNTGITYYCQDGNCTFADLVAAAKRFANFMVVLGLSLSVLVIAYVGWIYMTSGGSASERKKANDMLLKVAKGIVFMIAAWLIVHLITSSLLKGGIQNVI